MLDFEDVNAILYFPESKILKECIGIGIIGAFS